MSRRIRVRRQLLAAVPLSFLVTAVVGAQSVASTDTLRGVAISRRALTISLPLDTSVLTGTPPRLKSGWRITIGGDESTQSTTLSLTFRDPIAEPAYRSATHPASCTVLTDAYSCRDSASAVIVNGRFVITVRDSAMLALLFGDRPTHLSVFAPAPLVRLWRAVVRYVDPQLLPASKEALAEYDRALGREGWSPWTRTLWAGPANGRDTLWMQVGERTTASVAERQGRAIDSFNQRSDFTVARWTSSDSSVVAFAPSNDPPRSITLVALRPGRTTIAANGLRGASDELPRSQRARSLTRDVIVTNPLTRIEIVPRPSKIVAGARFELVARVIDVNGAVVEGLPVDFYVIYDTPDPYGWEGKKYSLAPDVDLTAPGKRRFIARFAKFADTLDVQVVPRGPR